MSLPTLLKFNFRYYRRHSLLSLLCILGISLGVGIVVSVELINNSALASFSSSVDFLSGRATHSVVSGYGSIDERFFAPIWSNPQVRAASPVVEAIATAVETGRDPIRFVGIDPFLDAAFRDFTPRGNDDALIVRFLAGATPSAYLSSDLMERHGLKSGDTLTVLVAGVRNKVSILGPLPGSADMGQGEDVAVMDIAAAQELFGRIGQLERIDIILKGNVDGFTKTLPASLKLTDANARKATLKAILYSFQLNLAAMSLLAIFVGVFLIYNFSMFSVLSRREDSSLLLTLGCDRNGLMSAFILESLILGTAGSLLGIAFGYLVAWLSIEKVSGTIRELYFHVNVETVGLTWPVVLIGLGVGYLATLIGTGVPALEVAVTPPILGMKRRSIEDRAHGLKGLLVFLAFLCVVGALITAWASRFSIFWGFVSAFAMTFAFALFTPGFLSPFCHHLGILAKKLSGSLELFLAARTIRASLSRTSIAVAALAVALSMTVGVDTMIYSFRGSVANWLDGSLEGDLYVSPGTTKWTHPLPDTLIENLRHDPRVKALERYAAYDVTFRGKPVRLRIVDAPVLEHHSRFHFLAGGDGAWHELSAGKVFVSEPLAYRFGVGIGDEVVLITPEGPRPFQVTAVLRDYSFDQGTIHMDRSVYERIWKDTRVQSVAIFLQPGVSRAEMRRSVVEQFPGLDRTIVSSSKMKEDALTIFDKTFAVTATLKGVSLLVALLGVATALTAILMERSREMKVLGYLGFTPRELGRMNVYQALIMGLASFLISAVCGLVLSYIIIYAINYRSFGWSIDVSVNPWVFGKTFVLTALACLAASFYPTYRLTRQRAPAVLEEE